VSGFLKMLHTVCSIKIITNSIKKFNKFRAASVNLQGTVAALPYFLNISFTDGKFRISVCGRKSAAV